MIQKIWKCMHIRLPLSFTRKLCFEFCFLQGLLFCKKTLQIKINHFKIYLPSNFLPPTQTGRKKSYGSEYLMPFCTFSNCRAFIPFFISLYEYPDINPFSYPCQRGVIWYMFYKVKRLFIISTCKCPCKYTLYMPKSIFLPYWSGTWWNFWYTSS